MVSALQNTVSESSANWGCLSASEYIALPHWIRTSDAVVPVCQSEKHQYGVLTAEMPVAVQTRRVQVAMQSCFAREISIVVSDKLQVSSIKQQYNREQQYTLKDYDAKLDWDVSLNRRTLAQEAVQSIVELAVKSRASDIHLQFRRYQDQERCRLLLRIYGEMKLSAIELSADLANAVANYLFSQGRRGNCQWQPHTPQDGSFEQILATGKRAQLRLASLPEVQGWDLIARLFCESEAVPELSELGYNKSQITAINNAFQQPYGLVVFAGPTNSGKSTALLSAVRDVEGDRKIVSLEQPVERVLPNVSQIQCSSAEQLLEFLPCVNRWDTDIAILGEVRDRQSAKVAANLCMSGKLTGITVHAPRAGAVIERLIDLGVSSYLLNQPDFVRLIVAQRLIPLLCKHCCLSHRQLATTVSSALEETGLLTRLADIDVSALRFRGGGCSAGGCRGGLIGLTVCPEILHPVVNTGNTGNFSPMQARAQELIVDGSVDIRTVAKLVQL